MDGFLDFEAPAFAAALSDPVAWPAGWPTFDRALVVSRDPALIAAIRRHARDVLSCDPTPGPAVHAASWYTAALAPWNIRPLEVEAVFFLPADEANAAAKPLLERLGERFVAIHPGSGSSRKNWPADRFAALAREFSSNHPWLLVEGPADRDAASLLRDLPGAVVGRDLPLGVLASVLSKARLYVGNDSGISHLAAAVGAPSLVLFGPTDPNVWGPRGRRVRALRAEGALQHLAVSSVVTAARELLSLDRHT